MKQVILKALQHRGAECICIYFDKNASIQAALQKIAGVKFSGTKKCWYIPLSRENYYSICVAVNKLARVEQTELRQYLISKNKNPSLRKTELTVSTATVTAVAIAKKVEPGKMPVAIVETVNKNNSSVRSVQTHSVNGHVLPAMRQKLTLKAYSASTAKTYLNEVSQLLQLIGAIPADDLTPEHLRRYLVYCFDTLKLSENTLHSRINAMKFYYEQVLGREKFFWDIPRPKKPFLLPRLLNEKELSALFNALENKKHKAMLFTAYSAGLRVSEIVNLKIADIDSGRMQILIARAKGKKDRYVNLSPILLDILRKYIMLYKPKPLCYLFESEQTQTAYPQRTVQQIFSNAKNKAGIRKEVGIHSLRHSFATHLLDKGTDIKYIKDLLGHFNIKTTERYLHVSKKQLINIISPFDDLWGKEQIEW